MTITTKEIFDQEIDQGKVPSNTDFLLRLKVAAALVTEWDKEMTGSVSTEINVGEAMREEVSDEDVDKLRDLIRRIIIEVKEEGSGDTSKWRN